MCAVLTLANSVHCATSLATSAALSFPPVGLVLPEQEFSAVGKDLQEKIKSWKFLPPEVEQKFEKGVAGIKVEGYQFKEGELRYGSDGQLGFKFTFDNRAGANAPTLTPNDIMVKVAPVFAALREQGMVLTSNVDVSVNHGMVLISGVSVADKGGENFLPHHRLAGEETSVFTESGRRTMLISAIEQAESISKDPALLRGTAEKLSVLRDYYQQNKESDPRLGLLAQAVILHLDGSPEQVVRFSKMHHQHPMLQFNDLPAEAKRYVDHAVESSKYVPTEERLREMETIGRNVQLSKWVTNFLNVEALLGVVSDEMRKRTEIELKADVALINKSVRQDNVQSVEQLLEKITQYYNNDQPSHYLRAEKLGSGLDGFAARIASHDTDCSSRSMRVREVLGQFGIQATIRVIEAAGEVGQSNSGEMAHTYLSILKADGTNVFYDPSRPAGQPAVFSSEAPIIEMYAGPGNESKVRVSNTLVTDQQVLTKFLIEHLGGESVHGYLKPLAESGLSRTDYLRQHPEMIGQDRHTRAFGRAVLTVDPDNEVAKACTGESPELLRKLFNKE